VTSVSNIVLKVSVSQNSLGLLAIQGVYEIGGQVLWTKI
jgi:hypothetical protein